MHVEQLADRPVTLAVRQFGLRDQRGDGRERPGGVGCLLRVTAPVALARQQLVSRLADFLRAHPEVRIELDLSEIDKLDASAIQLLIAIRRSDRMTLTGMTDALRARMAELGA